MTNYTSNMSVVTSEYDNFYFYSYRLKMADVRAELFKLKSPNSRFMYTRDLLLKHNILMTPLDDDDEYDEYNEYDHPDTSTSYRQNGNVFFKDKLYVKAVEMYTKCLKGCKTNTECYALAQANRSAAYFHTGEYEHCLNDAFSALKSKNYPSKLAYKLYQRMGHAERILGFVEQAKESYALCLERLDEADMSAENKRRFRAEVEKFVTECEKQPTERKRPMETPCVEQLVGGRNENIPALSSFVELKMSESMERGVYATRDINPGDVVAIDEPYIGWPFPECAGVCNFNGCMKINSALIQCPKCKLVSYCNKDCMNKDDKDGHNLECTIIYIIRTTIPGISKINELAMKWFLKDYLKMGLKKYCSIIDNYNFSESKINPITRGFDEIGQYKSDNFLTAYSLVSSKIISTDVSFFFNCIAAHMLHYLVCSGFRIPDCYIGTVGASLVQILTVLDLSYRKLNALSFRRSDILLSRTMALTLYPSISLFNHSCDANISPSGNMFDRIRVMKAIQPIPKGTQKYSER
eukprot:XP_016659659.1 PREDICTED: SET and MYND domain-containing protein 4-like isoform X2 [Acyrthosiphon pisum]